MNNKLLLIKVVCCLLFFFPQSCDVPQSVTQVGGQNIGSTYKPTQAQSSYVQLWEVQIKSANCSVKISESNLNVKLEARMRGAF